MGCDGRVTPTQIALVEDSLRQLDLAGLAADFYARAFAADPAVAGMFTSDPDIQRARFAAELDEIVRSIHDVDDFEPRVRSLGARHRGFGVRAAHYRLMGAALVEALAAALPAS